MSSGSEPKPLPLIMVPEWKAAPLKIGADAGCFGENSYFIEEIGEPFTDKSGLQMVRVTLVERKTQ
jgi:hypothetical protein